MALKQHKKDIALFQKAAQQLQEQDVKQFAEQVLPKLQKHQQHAARVAQTVGVDQSTISAIMTGSPEAVGGTADDDHEDHQGVDPGERTRQGAGARELKKDRD